MKPAPDKISIDPAPCVINPQRSRIEPAIDSPALLIPLPGDLERMTRLFREAGSQCYKDHSLRVFHFKESKRNMALAGPAVGAPQAVMILEKLIALGAGQVILLGWIGGLQPYLSFGDLLLPDGAFSEEGTSAHYSKEKRPKPSANLFQELRKALQKGGVAFRQGPVWTTDAPYRETIDKVKTFQSQGLLGVDMETSAVFTVGAFRGIETAALLVVSDDLSRLKWRHGFREPQFKESRNKVIDFLFRFCLPSRTTGIPEDSI
ncbi:MAG: nucleoside phosphorylase [Thermodesulfobacteriota bacterium]